ncbi:hypothetical protein EON65_02140 [archaeon]|nr:MAG: hypothetical protein EON65_02140 [archaeon]
MYGGLSKEGGAVVGRITNEAPSVELGDAQDATGAEESLICQDDQGRELALVAQLDPNTGDVEWTATYDVDYVKNKTVAMSQMTSMLRDADRNQVYEEALKIVTQNFRNRFHKSPTVLDIGAGTGLLSLFAAKNGAEAVYGVEMFDTLASVAQSVVQANGLADRVFIINAKSTSIEAFPNSPDILVSEILDSALLGESVLPSHADAIRRLLANVNVPSHELSERIIPNRAEIFCSLLESLEVHSKVCIQNIRCGREHLNVFRSEAAQHCIGANAALPVHYEALQHRGARLLSEPSLAMKVDFSQSGSLAEGFVSVWESEIACSQQGTLHGILMYWNAFLLSPSLDPLQKLRYSTMPGAQNWQDHWQQVVFPLAQAITISPGDLVRVQLVHDEVNMWAFATKLTEESRKVSGHKRGKDESEKLRTAIYRLGEESFQRPHCACGWHLLCTPQRLQMLSSAAFNDSWGEALEQAMACMPSGRFMLDISDGSHLSLMAGLASRRIEKQGVKIVSREKKEFSRLFYSQITVANDLEENIMLWDGVDMFSVFEYFSDLPDEDDDNGMGNVQQMPIGALVSDCCYYQLHALPTWQALSFFYQRRSVAELMATDCIVLPARAMINVALVQLHDLSVSHGQVGRYCLSTLSLMLCITYHL